MTTLTLEHAGFVARFSAWESKRAQAMKVMLPSMIAANIAGAMISHDSMLMTMGMAAMVGLVGVGLIAAASQVLPTFRVDELELAAGNLTLETTRGRRRTRTETPLDELEVEARGGALCLSAGGREWSLPLSGWDPASVDALCALLGEQAAAAADTEREEPPPNARALLARAHQTREPS